MTRIYLVRQLILLSILELLKRRRQARTSVEHLDYDNYSQQRTDAFQQQMQQAKTEKKAYDQGHGQASSISNKMPNYPT